MTTDLRTLVARMADELDHCRQLLMLDCRETHPLAAEARAILAKPLPPAGEVADGPAVPEDRESASATTEPRDDVVWCWVDNQGFVRGHADHPCGFWICDGDIGEIVRAALARWGRPAPQPIPVSERLPELRGQFERILCVARSSGGPTVGNIQLADRLISAVRGWLPAHALPLPSGDVEA